MNVLRQEEPPRYPLAETRAELQRPVSRQQRPLEAPGIVRPQEVCSRSSSGPDAPRGTGPRSPGGRSWTGGRCSSPSTQMRGPGRRETSGEGVAAQGP